MFNFIISDLFFHQSIIFSLFVSIVCGLDIRLALPFCEQIWVQTLQHTLSYAMLPLITFIITKVISGNIALSLGMIGALSIVRFRTPVKNPLELIIYFALITIGISGAVNLRLCVYLTVLIVLILIAIITFLISMKLINSKYHLFF